MAKKIKTVKGYLKAIHEVSETAILFLNGYDKLTEKEFHFLANISAAVVNEFDAEEYESLLKKFNIKR